jgi:acetolactate synthase-1/3 small subunit
VTQHTLSVLVENKPGVLSRVAGMFTRRGYNIDSLAVSPTEDENRSRMTITVDASRFPVEQITKQLDKLINVIKVRDLDPGNMVARELGLFKVSTREAQRADVLALVDIFKGEIVDVTSESMIIQATGTTAELENLEELLRGSGLVEMVRTGVVALGRGGKTT